MGLDLTLLPVDALDIKADTKGISAWGFSHTVIPLGNGSAIYDAIKGKEEELPKGHNISSYVARGKDGDSAYGTLKDTPYGEPYTWITAEQLLPALRESKAKGRPAAVAFVEAMAPDAKIILHWH